ncbi:MAG: hypothetical protein ACYC6T_05480 [Thermoleophilia bacterium]
MDLVLALKILAVFVLTAFLVWRFSHAYRTERVARRHILDGFAAALSSTRIEKGLQGLPRLKGVLDDRPLHVALNSDTLALRTLPTLWLEARWAGEHGAVVDALLEPSGTEYFTEDIAFDSRVEPPKGWPQSAVVRASGFEAASVLEGLTHVDPTAFPALKYVLLDRHEVRVIMKCARADRQTYRVLRSASFKPDAVTPELVDQTIAALRSIEDALRAATVQG